MKLLAFHFTHIGVLSNSFDLIYKEGAYDAHLTYGLTWIPDSDDH